MKKKKKNKKKNFTKKTKQKKIKRRVILKKKKIKRKKNKNIKKKIIFKKNRQKSKLLQTKKIFKTRDSLILKIVRIQNKLTNFPKVNLNFFSVLDKKIESFFQGIEKRITSYQVIREEEKQKNIIQRLEKEERDKQERIKVEKDEELRALKLKEKQLKEEQRLEKERTKDLKLFLRKEQAIIRKEQAERQKRFLQEIKLEKQIEKFRIREIKELEKLEKISLQEQREDYEGLQDRIAKLKDKYQQIRDQKIRERVEALGVEIQDGDSREILLEKEKQYNLDRQKIELALESFYRSANSLVFQLNKRYITRQMSIFRCIDRRFESGEIFIKWDESQDEEWLILIYIKDNSPNQGIIIEDKTNPEKNISNEFQPNEIFKASDMMVDSLTQLISKIRSNKGN
tara:strand:+ start:54 stop:1250 length:1197 start_codon:yes stop_codon:yes gene_type:complete